MAKQNAVLQCLLMVLLGGLAAATAGASDRIVLSQGAEAYGPVTPYLTQPLSTLPQQRAWQPGDPVREIPRRIYPDRAKPQASGRGAVDVLPQHNTGVTAPTLQLGANFNGIGFTGAVPPDTVGDIGPNHYVQSVNASSVAVFDKTGTMLFGPFQMDSLAPVGDQCRNGGGDPIVLYDQMADRWFLQEFISGGNRLCIYISATPDPAGAYFFYGFGTPSFPDYPHFGVWHDAYIAGTNEGNGNETTYAFERAKMLAGLPASMQRLTAVPPMSGYGFQVLTPADHDGANPPPANAPGIFMRHFDDEAHSGSPNPATDLLQIFELAVDWDTPANTTVTQLPSVTISDYNSWFINYTTFFSIPQPGTSTRLDPIREAILNRLVYRNFGTHEALVGNFATNRNPATSGSVISAGIRWFELRRTGGPGNPWVLHQEGTFGGDTNSPTAQFFMGGIAMDGVGNIGLGYSKTDTNATTPVNPSIGITGRLATDPPGAMAGETVAVAGVQPSTQGGGRWGDYAAMGIDPADDCTFWYTNEYMPGSSWGTRITAFLFEECLFGFTLDVQPAEVNMCALDDPDPQFVIELDETGGWSDMVNLSATGLPPGTSAQFSANGQTPPFVSTLTIADTDLSETGSYAIEIVGTGTDVPPTVRNAQVLLNLALVEPEVPQLESPIDGAPAMPLQPTLAWSAAADATEYLVEVATDAGFSNIVYSATEQGTSHQLATSLEPLTQYFWRVTAGNQCGAVGSAVRSFSTVAISCAIYESTDVPVSIPTTIATVSSDLTVPDGGAVTDVNVLGLVGTHTFPGDLVFRLRSPIGTEVTLVSRMCGTADDFDINFDDSAGGPVVCPLSSGGTFQPLTPLSAINGDEAGGTWVLEIADEANQDGGQLQAWSLEICLEADPGAVPAFTSTPVTEALRGEQYTYEITAEAPSGNDTIEIVEDMPLPSWLSLVDHGGGSATLSGTPDFGDLGPHAITLRAQNGGVKALQSFTITVEDVNEPPQFTSTAPTTGTRGQPYSYAVTATDPNPGAVIAISLQAPAPGWLNLVDNGNGTATLSGTPGFPDVGPQAVTLVASDGELSDEQAFTIDVADINVTPAFTSTPVTSAATGVPYLYEVTATDPNLGATLAISSIGPLPGWLTLEDHGDGTATLSGIPQQGDVGDVYLVLEVSDGSLSAEQPFAITVSSANLPPQFTSTPTLRALIGQPYSYAVTVTDANLDAIDIGAGSTLPAWLSLVDNGDGTATLSGTPVAGDEGEVEVVLVASDGAAETEQAFTIEVVDEAVFADGFEEPAAP